jgi:hypothetical protein
MTTKPEDEETIVAAEVIKDLLCLVQRSFTHCSRGTGGSGDHRLHQS